MPTKLVMCTLRCCIALLACVGLEVSAAIIRVPQDAPFIQLAIDAAQVHDTVLLDTGRFVESVEAPARDLTIAGRFLLSGDTTDIGNCTWVGVNNGDDTLRCLHSDGTNGNAPFVRIVGIRFANSGTYATDEGGAIRIFQQNATIEHCHFDSCYAGFGGALAVRQGQLTMRHCRFSHCGQIQLASVLRLRAGTALIDSCIIESDTAYSGIFDSPLLFWVQRSKLIVRNSIFRDLGYSHYEWGGTFVYGSKPPDSVEIVNCEAYDNHIEVMIADGGQPIKYLRLDSCHFHDNILTQSLYGQGSFDSLTEFQAVGNVFERFEPYFRALMHGVFALDTSSDHTTRVKHNLIQEIQGGHTSFGTIYGDNSDTREVAGNYIVQNGLYSGSAPFSGQIQGIHGPGPDEVKHNVFMGNVGYAAYQGGGQVQGYVQNNFWGHESGPYDSVRNPFGQGDTVSYRLVYEPWEEDTSFFSAAPEPREPVEIPATFIGNAYPNPFNSTVTIEFVLLHDMEITLDIFDLTGRRVETVFSGRMNKGVHIRDWQPKSQASGIYFARLAGEKRISSTVKLLYMK
ncbi:T9SS type A sorting domain-containing protein [bacterium]|nr:T9SS type A sorting domain-containing protein [bacterium]